MGGLFSKPKTPKTPKPKAPERPEVVDLDERSKRRLAQGAQSTFLSGLGSSTGASFLPTLLGQ